MDGTTEGTARAGASRRAGHEPGFIAWGCWLPGWEGAAKSARGLLMKQQHGGAYPYVSGTHTRGLAGEWVVRVSVAWVATPRGGPRGLLWDIF